MTCPHEVIHRPFERAGFAIAYPREAVKGEETKFGDLFPYGVGANRSAIEALVRYAVADGASLAPLALERIFAAGILDT